MFRKDLGRALSRSAQVAYVWLVDLCSFRERFTLVLADVKEASVLADQVRAELLQTWR